MYGLGSQTCSNKMKKYLLPVVLLFFLALAVSVTADTYLTGCSEITGNIIECTGTLTGTSMTVTNASIWIHDADTSAELGTVNTSYATGYINISNFTVSDAVATKWESTTMYIYDYRHTGTGGNGGTGSTGSNNDAGGVAGNGGTGGTGQGVSFTLETEVKSVSEFNLSLRGGNGGTGGKGGSCSQNGCTAGAGGQGGATSTVVLTGTMFNDSNLMQYVDLQLNTGTGGTGGANGNCNRGGGGWSGDSCKATGAGGNVNSLTYTITGYDMTFEHLNNNFTGTGGTRGSKDCGGCDSDGGYGAGGSNGQSRVKFNVLYRLALSSHTFDFDNPASGYNIWNFTSQEVRLGFFNSSLLSHNTYVYCPAESVIYYGNDSTVTVPDPQLDFTYCSAYVDGNITYQPYDTFFETDEITLTINSPEDNYNSDTNLSVNYTVESSVGSLFTNISLFINNSVNASSINVTNGTNALINGTGMPDGTYSWYVRACTNYTNEPCENSPVRTFTLDSTRPGINFYSPATVGNVTPYNLTTNIQISGSNLDTVIYEIFFPNGTSHYSNTTASPSSPFTFADPVTFTEEFNYTVNVTANNTAGGNNTQSTWFYFDMTSPSMEILTPTGIGADRSIIFTTNTTEISPKTCRYYVTDSNLNLEISDTGFDCSGASFTVSSDGNYILFTNVTDGVYSNNTNQSFGVDTTVGRGGGGAGVGDYEKTVCDITVSPEELYLGISLTLSELVIENNEDFSYAPTYSIQDVQDEVDYTSSLEITNLPGTILQNSEGSLGIRYNSNNDEVGANMLVLSSDDCADINVPIYVNTYFGLPLFGDLFDPGLPFLDNVINLATSSITSWGAMDFVQVWMVFGLLLVATFIVTFNKMKNNTLMRRKGSTVMIVLFNIFIAIFLTIFLYVLLNL